MSFYDDSWTIVFTLFSFLVTVFLVYKILRNSELSNSDNNMPLERHIKIKKIDLIIESVLYILVYFLAFSLIITLPFSAILAFIAIALPAAFVIFKAFKKKYDAVQELSKTKS